MSQTAEFFAAVKQPNIDQVERLLESNFPVDARDPQCLLGYTPLMTACEFLTGHPEQVEMVCLLLNFDADVNAVSFDNSTPLMIACRESTYGRREDRIAELMDLLVNKGADINAANKYGTILHQVSDKPEILPKSWQLGLTYH